MTLELLGRPRIRGWHVVLALLVSALSLSWLVLADSDGLTGPPVLLIDGRCWVLHPGAGDGLVLELRDGRLEEPRDSTGS